MLSLQKLKKLPVTIVSRCQRYTFRRITSMMCIQRLSYVAEMEGFGLDPAATDSSLSPMQTAVCVMR